MNLQFHMQTQANASGDFLSFHGRSNPQSPISTLGFRSSALRQPLLPLLSHKSDAKRPIPLLRVRVVAEHSVDGNRSVDSSPAKALRRILTSLGIQQCPACFDALSAKLVERAGFRCCFTSGFSISGARLGLPDAGLISYGEMLDQGRQITEAVSIPVIGDADNGYGNAMNVKRTVNGYIKAGFAGIMLEDQVSPRACGHTQGRKVVSREEAVMRIRAAIDARKECGSDIVILARTDSRQALSFEEALWRTKALADAGADVLFIDALTSKQEMKAFCETAPLVPKLATMLEGGGKIPILDLSELEDVGYKLVAYPLSLIGVSILAMQNALNAIRSGYIPSPGSMPSFEKIKEILGFNCYYEEEKRYATSTSQSPSQSVSSSGYGVQHSATNDAEKKGVPRHPRVDGQRVYSSRIESRKLRIKTTGRDGVEKIDARVPAGGNLEGLTKFIPGFSISAARLGLPDTGLISYGEMVEQGRLITEAVSIPVIGDGDNGYGNAMNVKRTVKGYIRAGFAGIILEDQVSPKACGHTQGRKTVSREEAVMRIKAAVDARKESGSDIVIVARSDSRQAISFDESLWRSRAFADAGADVLFIDALTSREEMKAFCEIAPQVPKMASMLEGGGKTPILNLLELEEIGYKIVAYPLSLLGVSIQAMKDALVAIKGGRIPPPGSMPSFEEIKEILGFNNYYEEEKRYATSRTSSGQLSSQRVSSRVYDTEKRTQDNAEQRDRSPESPVVEVITPDVYNNSGAVGSRDPFSGIWARTLRVKITGNDGFEKLDVRIPAGFLEGVTNIVPALGGVNLKELLDDAAYEPGGKLLLDFNDRIGDRIQVFLE